MSEKQDRQGVRTEQDIERKYSFGKRFSEILGLIDETRDSVDSVSSILRHEFKEQMTSLTRDTEKIVLAALEESGFETELGSLRKTLNSELKAMADKISMNFDKSVEQITNVNGDLQTVIEDLQKHFDFTVDGLTVKAGENAMQLLIDNDMIRFAKNGKEFGWWDGVDFHTGNIVVELNERAQFGNFAFVPRSNGSLDFLKVGG